MILIRNVPEFPIGYWITAIHETHILFWLIFYLLFLFNHLSSLVFSSVSISLVLILPHFQQQSLCYPFVSTEEQQQNNNMFENSSVFVMDILGNLVTFIAPLWIAVIFGVVVGWAWKPKWAIEPNNYSWSWSTNLFKFRIPWFNDSDLQNQHQPGFEHSTTRFVCNLFNTTLLLIKGMWLSCFI